MKTIDAGRVVGRSAYEDAVLQGYQGSLDEWIASLQGSDGKSAYQSWLDAGHVGTEEQFLAALKGETGTTGATGPKGDTGTTFTPSIDADGNVSWTNDGGKVNPTTVNVKGAQGVAGPKGEAGDDGVSPTVSISKTGTVTTVTITDKDGAHTATINDGSQGATGPQGDTGTTFTPSIDAEGNVSWTNDGGKTNPATVNVKGATGATGPQGEAGDDGVSPTVSISKTGTVTTVTITDKDGAHTATINDGSQGATGATGNDGVSPTVSVSKTDGVTTITIIDKDGTHTATINDGAKGDKGDKGDTPTSMSAENVTTSEGISESKNVQADLTALALNMITSDEGGQVEDIDTTLEQEVEKLEQTIGKCITQTDDNSSADLNFGDANGNVVVQFKDGHIKTKNFDSSNIKVNAKRRKSWITCAHRGNVVGTSLHENTLAAYYRAAIKECDMIELDARATSDGVLISNHDETVTDINGTTYTIASITSAEATNILLSEDSVYGKQYVPTLEDCLNLCYYMNIKCNIDLKNGGTYAEDVAKLVLKTGMRGRAYYAMNGAAATYIEAIANIDEDAKFIGSVSAFSEEYLNELSLDLRKRCVIYSYSASDVAHIRDLGVSALLTSITSSNIDEALQTHPEILEYAHNVDFEEIENNIISNIKLY